MTSATPPIAGYKPLSEDKIALVNQMKHYEEMLLRHLDLLDSSEDLDPRWYAVGRRHIEQGFMELNRSIMQPGRIMGKL